MKYGALIYGLGGLLIGLLIGFWVANAVSRNLSTAVFNQNSKSLQKAQPTESSDEKLSREEIKAAFTAAENRKEDAAFQKNVGLALYRYAKMQNDSSFLPELVKLLERAEELSSEKDSEIITALADSYFIEAREKSEPSLFQKARNLYQQAVKLNPDDAVVRTAYATTFLFSKPAKPETAIAELNSVLKQDPGNESALQLLVLALIQNNKLEAAEQRLSELKKINSNNPAISDLEAQLNQNKMRLNH